MIRVKEIEKNEQELIRLTKELNNCGADWRQRCEQLSAIHVDLKSLASSVGASLVLGATILNVENVDGSDAQSQCVRLEAFIGELLNNMHYTLQTEMMLNACISAKRSCFWAAVAAILACFSVILTMCLN